MTGRSFFRGVLEDIKIYGENVEETKDVVASQDPKDTYDDNFKPDPNTVILYETEFTLTKKDFWFYLIGILVRIQTIVLGYILFAVETSNTCVVAYESNKPLSVDMLPVDLNTLPGSFANMSRVFETVIMMLFITSVCTSIMYINKVVRVIKFHRASR